MNKPPVNIRDRWVSVPRIGTNRRTKPISASQVYSEEGEISSTASLFIEDEEEDGPIETGLLDSEGNSIVRFPWREKLPVGFHYRPEDYEAMYDDEDYD